MDYLGDCTLQLVNNKKSGQLLLQNNCPLYHYEGLMFSVTLRTRYRTSTDALEDRYC
jgi:hypothetical protein